MSNTKGILICIAALVVIGFPYWLESRDQPSESEYEAYQQERMQEEEDAIEQYKEDDPIQYALDQNSDAISWEDASDFIDEYVIVCGVIEEVDTESSSSDPIYVDMGDYYPNDRVTGVLWPEYQSEFPDIESYEGELVYMEGQLYDRDGIPNIKLTDGSQISIVE